MARGLLTKQWCVLLAVGWVLWSVGGASTAAGARIAEVLTAPQEGPHGEYPAYVELFSSDPPPAFDVAVMNATPDRELRIEQMVRVEPEPGRETLLVHEGAWPEDSGVDAQRIALPEGGLALGSGSSATARRLVVFNEPAVRSDTGARFAVDTSMPATDLWAETLEVTDSVALSLNGGGVGTVGPDHAPLEAEVTLELDHGEAAYRRHDGENYLGAFESGSLDEALSFESGAIMNPGRLNDWPGEQPAALPEPTAGAMLGLALLVGLMSKRGRRRTRLLPSQSTLTGPRPR